MSLHTVQEPTADMQRQLDMVTSQLALYARDLKRMVDAERHKARALAESNERLRILDRLKTDFLAFISHELRTPLNAMAAVDLFDPHDDPQQQAMVIDLIRQGYERLHGFIQKGLDYFTWLTAGRVETTESADLAEIVQLAADSMPGLAEPGVDFQMTCTTGPCLVRGETRHLVDVVRIVLDNALKFCQEEKYIRVHLRTTAAQVLLTISDRGQGFPGEFARELFQPFTITDATHHFRGTGLNLALARVIIEAHGGQIEAHSEGVGQGATFTMTFPVVSLSSETAIG
jgi:signal transduction histidine kinase